MSTRCSATTSGKRCKCKATPSGSKTCFRHTPAPTPSAGNEPVGITGQIRENAKELAMNLLEMAVHPDRLLPDTLEDLIHRRALVCVYSMAVEGADYGAGYQFSQVKEMERIKVLLAAIDAKVKDMGHASCEICGTKMTVEDHDNNGGFCSYDCASGGGGPAPAAVAVAEPEQTCWGCRENQPNQLAHVDPGGCLYTPDDI
jgi:hypothetical protein